MATPSVLTNMRLLSIHVPRRTAEITPTGMAMASASTMAKNASEAVTGRAWAMISVTSDCGYL